MNSSVIVVLLCLGIAEASEEIKEVNLIEARGHGKYALLTHLAFLLAAKVGLYKIILGIALVVASMKIMVVMAWALAIFKYVPDVWPNYKQVDVTYHGFDKYHDRIGYEKYHDTIGNKPIHFFYVVVTKLIVLKIVYGIIFFALISKAWHFVLWFIHYLKEKKHAHEYIEIDHDHHDSHDYGHGHYDYGHHDYGHHDYGHHDSGHHNYGHRDYSHHDHEPYKGQGYGSFGNDDYYPQKKKGMYDADGSYSVKGAR